MRRDSAGGFTTLPPDLTTLCAAGSILQNCYGTLGTAHCSALVFAGTNGACGTSNGASCGDHDDGIYLAKVNAMKREFQRYSAKR